MALAPGTRLGPYEITSPIGAGGMGEVYRARDTRLDRSVAVKVLPSEFASDAQLRLRFEREARAISALSHPNICTLYDVGENYLVMELLDGESLADRLARGPLSLPEVFRHGIEIADALHRAHRGGIVHRDLKPGNVMLTKSGAKLLDFGLARRADAVGVFPNAPTEKQQPLTAEGTIVGTFQYMAPEQLEGATPDARTDIFALGALLYEMATGHRAFDAKTKTSLIAAIVSGQPRPMSAVQPLTPPALEHVVAKCLEKDPEARWQSAHDVAEELRWIRDTVGRDVAVRRYRQPWLAWSLAAIALVAAGWFGWRELRRERDGRALVASIAAPRGMELVLHAGGGGSVTVSPDGRYVTFFAAAPNGEPALYVRALDSHDAREIVRNSNEPFPFWSPDSRQLAFFAEGKLKRIDVAGSAPVTICDAPKGRSGSWNRDGIIIFSPDSTSPIHKVAASGGKSAPLTTLNEAKRETTHRWATFLPDGNHFLYMAGTHAGARTSDTNAVYVASLDGGAPRFLLNSRSNVAYSAGHLIYVAERTLVARRFDTHKFELAGEPFAVADSVDYDRGFFRAVFAASDEGTLVYQPGSGTAKPTLAWVDRNGRETATFGEPGYYAQIRLSPDDKMAALTVDDPTSGASDIWIHDFEDNRTTRLTLGKGDERDPIWSPDGRFVAYTDLRSGFGALYVRSADGSVPERIVRQVPGQDVTPNEWSPDGKFIAVTESRPNRKGDALLIPASGEGEPVPIAATEADEEVPLFSPDGKWIAYISHETGRPEIFVVSYPAGKPRRQVSTAGVVVLVRWTRHGIAFIGRDANMAEIPVRLAGGVPTFGAPVPRFKVSSTISGDLSRHSDRGAVIRARDEDRQPLMLITRWPLLKRER